MERKYKITIVNDDKNIAKMLAGCSQIWPFKSQFLSTKPVISEFVSHFKDYISEIRKTYVDR